MILILQVFTTTTTLTETNW